MAKQTDQLDELRVSELREKAKEAGVAGTSHMRKDDLIHALDEGQAKASPRGAGRADDAIALLIADHENVKALFKEALDKESGDADLESLAKTIIGELKRHTEAEEKIFYPALKKKAIDADEDEAKDEVLEAYVEHASVKDLIAKIEASTAADESYKAMIQVMSEQVDHHVEEEESEMFKQARELLGSDELLELGQQIAALKESAKATAAR